jgi:hypothetical protein
MPSDIKPEILVKKIRPILNPINKIQILEDDIEGFGPWKILLSNNAVGHLRQWRRKDRAIFNIIRNKLQYACLVSISFMAHNFVFACRQLSDGFFQGSNQKRLIGEDNEVPIFEAKITGDTRLVYAIDCIPDDKGEVRNEY